MISLNKNRIEGFTIVELLVVMALFAILSSLFYFGFSIVQKSSQQLINNYSTEIELNNLLRQLNHDFSSADSIVFEEGKILYYIDQTEGTIHFSENEIHWNKGLFNEILHIDTSYYSLSKHPISNKIKHVDLTVKLGAKKHLFYLENKKQLW